MKSFVFLFTALFILSSCKKGDNYCNPPKELTGFVPKIGLQSPLLPVDMSLDYIDLYGNENDEILFSFSVPECFIRYKGETRPTDVKKDGFYTYVLKDPENPPFSVEVEAYVFNDCGKSEIVKSTIYFDTVQ